MLRLDDVASYLNVSFRRVSRMRLEGKLPKARSVDGIGPLWKPGWRSTSSGFGYSK
jgi:hypothetical protein